MVGSQFQLKILRQTPMLWNEVPRYPICNHTPHWISQSSVLALLQQVSQLRTNGTATSRADRHPVPFPSRTKWHKASDPAPTLDQAAKPKWLWHMHVVHVRPDIGVALETPGSHECKSHSSFLYLFSVFCSFCSKLIDCFFGSSTKPVGPLFWLFPSRLIVHRQDGRNHISKSP